MLGKIPRGLQEKQRSREIAATFTMHEPLPKSWPR